MKMRSRLPSGRHRSAGFCAWVLLAAAAAAQEEQPEPEPLFTAFADKVQLHELLEFWVDQRGFSLEYDPALLEGPVTLRAGEGITEESLWATTNRILARRNLACIQMPGEDGLTIVPLDQASAAARIEPDATKATAGYVKTLLFTSPGNAADLAGALSKVLNGAGSQVTALSESDQILAAGLKPQVLEAIHILGLLDGSQRDSLVEEIPVRRGSPAGVAALLERIAAAKKKIQAGELTGTALARPESGSVIVVCPPFELETWRDLVRQSDRAESAFTAHYVPRRFGLRETRALIEEAVGKQAKAEPPQPWRLVSDELTATPWDRSVR